MNKLLYATDGTILFWCPGCDMNHGINNTWQITGTAENPTIKPSILTKWDTGEEHTIHVCHMFITNGKIQYLPDCTHSMANKTIDMVENE
jgi:hypothetical protein